MRFFLLLTPLLLLAASAAGCDGKSPAHSEPPPGVFQNPIRPDPQAIKQRKLRLIEPGKEANPSRFDGKR